MTRQVETIIVGGGQAGLATSYGLKQRDCEHIVLEQMAQAAQAWGRMWNTSRIRLQRTGDIKRGPYTDRHLQHAVSKARSVE